MNRGGLLLLAVSASFPLAVELPVDRSGGADASDAGESRVFVSAGAGSYASIVRDCEGIVTDKVSIEYREQGGEISHRFAGTPVTFGLRGGVVTHEIDSTLSTVQRPRQTIRTRYLNPHVSVEGENASVGVGAVFHGGEFLTLAHRSDDSDPHRINDLSFHLEAGDRSAGYFAVRWMESVPLQSRGGYLTLGGGIRDPGDPAEFEAGFSAGGPYDPVGIFLDTRFHVPRTPLLVRLGGHATVLGGDESHAGAAVGIEWRSAAR